VSFWCSAPRQWKLLSKNSLFGRSLVLLFNHATKGRLTIRLFKTETFHALLHHFPACYISVIYHCFLNLNRCLSNVPTSLVAETEFALRWLWGETNKRSFIWWMSECGKNMRGHDICVCVCVRERVIVFLVCCSHEYFLPAVATKFLCSFFI